MVNLKAVRDAPFPINVSELKAFLGMVNYYRSFLPNLSTAMEPMHQLLRKGVQWKWNEERSKAFCNDDTLSRKDFDTGVSTLHLHGFTIQFTTCTSKMRTYLFSSPRYSG